MSNITYCGVATKHSKSNFTNSLGDPLPDENVVFFNVEGSPYLHEIIDGNLVDTKLTENEIGRWLFNGTVQYQWKYMGETFYTLIQRKDFSATVTATKNGEYVPVVPGASVYGVAVRLRSDVTYPEPFFTSEINGHTQTRLKSLDDVILEVSQPVLPSTESSFTEAYNSCDNATNIYGWDGEIPAPGYYTQGSTHIQIFETPENGVIGVAT